MQLSTDAGVLARLRRQSGFTMVELLVVILIVGVLAAIAIPSFLNQKSKGEDTAVKSQARTAQTAMETYAQDNNGYTGATVAKLNTIESAITLLGSSDGVLAAGGAASSSPTTNGFRVTATGASGRKYWVDKSGSTVTRGCTVPSGKDIGSCRGAVAGTTDGSW